MSAEGMALQASLQGLVAIRLQFGKSCANVASASAEKAEKAETRIQADSPVNTDRTVLTDAMWERIESLLPGRKSDPGVTAGGGYY